MITPRHLRSIALTLLTVGCLAGLPPAAAETDYAWLDGLSLVLVDSDDAAGLHAATSAIHDAGGRVGLMSLPNVVVAWMPEAADAAVRAQVPVRHILRQAHEVSAVRQAAKVGRADLRTQRMLTWFEDVQTGTYQEQARARVATRKSTTPLGRSGDARTAQPSDPVDYLKNLQANGLSLDQLRSRGLILQKSGPGLPQITGNSDRMTGTVSVTLLFVESDGSGADPDLYTWTEADLQSYINGVNAGMLWWAQTATVYNSCWVAFMVHYIPGTDSRNQQWREIVTQNSGAVSSMVSEIMGNYGYNFGSHFTRVDAFNTAQRAGYGTDWAYTAFIGYNPPPASEQTPDGAAAFAYLLGPYTFLLFNSHSWEPNEVFPHESGHIFGACDEYSGGCTACNTCLGELNNNCEDCPGGNSACMMKANSFTLCTYTDEQVGWHDLNPCAPPVLAAPVLSSVSPTAVPKGASMAITLTGSNFLYGAFASFGDGVSTDSTVVIGSDSAIAYVSANSAADVGIRDATLSNRDLQSSSLVGGFEVLETRSHYFSTTGNNTFPYLSPAEAATSWADAIAAADSGDSVLVETGTVALPGGYVLNRGVTLYGGWSNNFTTRDLINDRTVLNLSGGSLLVLGSDPAGLDGFILENGTGAAVAGGTLISGDYGGAVSVNASALTLRNCLVRNNLGTSGNGYSGGGGLFAKDSHLTIDNSTFIGNSANRGGAVYLYQSTGSITGSSFAGNAVAQALSGGQTPWGAGVFIDTCTGGLTLQNNDFDGNSGAANGGGLYVVNSSAVDVTGGSFRNHSVSTAGLSTGGGVEVSVSSIDLQGVHFEKNTSGVFSGGLNAVASTLSLVECTFDSNSATLQGALGVNGGTVDIQHCFFRGNIGTTATGAVLINSATAGSFFGNTMLGNSGGSGAGGITLSSASVDVTNNIIANSVGHGIVCSGTPPTALDYNLVFGSSGNDWDGCSPGSHSVSADPLFVDATNGDVHLAVHSPAIDRGDPDVALQDPDGSRGDMGRYGSHSFVMQQPSLPQGLTGSSSGGDILLSWTANAEADLQYYAVYCDSTVDFVPSATNFLTTAAAADTSVNLGPQPCEWFTLAAVDNDGYASGYAARVQQAGTPTDVGQPAAYRFRLLANTPNPFNPNTRIDFELDRSRPVRLAIYDLAGRQVRLLVDRPFNAGRHSTVWDGRDHRGQRVASGVYFSRLESEDLRQTRKMVLLK